MRSNSPENHTRPQRNWGVIGVILGALGASICCIGPLILLALGAGGAYVGNLTALEAYRPYFMGVTAIFLGLAFYRVYRKPKEECAPGSLCAKPRAHRLNKISLWSATLLAVALLSFPYLAPELVREGQSAALSGSATARTVLSVENMTCASCEVTVNRSLTSLPGVAQAEVSLAEKRAVVSYDPQQVSVQQLIDATTRAGYPSAPAGSPNTGEPPSPASEQPVNGGN